MSPAFLCEAPEGAEWPAVCCVQLKVQHTGVSGVRPLRARISDMHEPREALRTRGAAPSSQSLGFGVWQQYGQ